MRGRFLRGRSRIRVVSGVLAATGVSGLGHGAGASDLAVQPFGSLSGTNSAYTTLGAKIGWGPLDKNGSLLLVSGGGDLRIDRIDRDAIILSLRRYGQAAALIGYQWAMNQGVIAGFAGPEAVYDGSVRRQTWVRAGAAFQLEAWLRPTDETLVNAVTIIHTARPEVWSRLAWGYRLRDMYVGPEMSTSFAVTGYGKAGLGLHVTDFGFAGLRWRGSVGSQWESHRASASLYLSLTAWAPM